MKTRAEEVSEAYKRGVQAERKATLHIMAAIEAPQTGVTPFEDRLPALRDALLKKGIWPSNEETELHAEIERLERDLADASVKCARYETRIKELEDYVRDVANPARERMGDELSELKTEILRLTLLAPPSEK